MYPDIRRCLKSTKTDLPAPGLEICSPVLALKMTSKVDVPIQNIVYKEIMTQIINLSV